VQTAILLTFTFTFEQFDCEGRFSAPADASDPDRTWSAPPLVTSFKGHVTVVTSLDFVDGHDCIVSSSDDCSLRLWTVYGAFVGIFGQARRPFEQSIVSRTSVCLSAPPLL